MLGNYLQQTTIADDIFRCIFSWRFKGELDKHIVHLETYGRYNSSLNMRWPPLVNALVKSYIT